MAKTMVKKSEFKLPAEQYLNIVKQGYKDYSLNIKFLKQELKN